MCLTNVLFSLELMPSYVVARVARTMAAYHKAKAHGEILDGRVNVVVVGQDGVGKTSVVRSLKGEDFNPDEASTDGVEMHAPLKNPGTQPWKNFTLEKGTTTYHYKCAECINRELVSESSANQTFQKGHELSSVSSSGSSDELMEPDLETGKNKLCHGRKFDQPQCII